MYKTLSYDIIQLSVLIRRALVPTAKTENFTNDILKTRTEREDTIMKKTFPALLAAVMMAGALIGGCAGKTADTAPAAAGAETTGAETTAAGS